MYYLKTLPDRKNKHILIQCKKMLLYLHTLVCVTKNKNYFVIQCSQMLLFTSLALPYSLYISHKQRENIFLTPPLPILLLHGKTAQLYFLSCTRSVRNVSDRIFLCEHLMDYNLARLHEPTLNLSAHA